jgi:hypothetical protein
LDAKKINPHFILAVVDGGQRRGNCKELLGGSLPRRKAAPDAAMQKNMGAAFGRAPHIGVPSMYDSLRVKVPLTT